MKYGHSNKFLRKQAMKRLTRIPENQWTEADIRFARMVAVEQEVERACMFGDSMVEPTAFQGLAARFSSKPPRPIWCKFNGISSFKQNLLAQKAKGL
jgi:hypothetical protein